MVGIIELIAANPKISIVVLSFLVTLVMTLVTKKFTNQSKMKELKDIQKACQIKLKQDGVKGNTNEMMKIQKQMMECSMELMKHSFKPIFITFIPLIVLFWWVGANLAYYPIMPGEQFSMTIILDNSVTENVSVNISKGVFIIGSTERPLTTEKTFLKTKKIAKSEFIIQDYGEYPIIFKNGKDEVSRNVLISKTSYLPALEKYDGKIEEVKINYRNTGFFGTYWIWTYIIVGVISSIVLRKLLKIV